VRWRLRIGIKNARDAPAGIGRLRRGSGDKVLDSSSMEFCCKREQKNGTVARVLRSRKSVWRWDILFAVSIVIGMTHRKGL